MKANRPSVKPFIRVIEMKNKLTFTVLLALSLLLTACGSPAAPVSATNPSDYGKPSESPTQAAAPVPTETAAPSAASGNVKVIIAGFAFSPANLTVKVGATVTWENQDGASHTIVADDGSFKSENLGEGGTFSFTFNTAGSFPYHCSIHSRMKGTITVVP